MKTVFPPEVKKNFGDILRSKRKQRGLSQDQLAGIIGIKHSKTIENWESGITLPNTKYIFKLSILYETQFEKLCKPMWDYLTEKYKAIFEDNKRKIK